MKVYAVIRTTVSSFENDACWDDGYYDDYYETQVSSDSLICICATEELAAKIANEENDKCYGPYDSVFYVEYDVLEKEF